MARRPTSDARTEGFGWKRLFSHLSTVLIGALCIAAVVGCILGMPYLERRSSELGFAAKPRVEVKWPLFLDENGQPAGTWLPVADQEAILLCISESLGERPDPFSRAPLEELGKTLQASGWFDGIPRITREANSTLKIDGSWRLPAAVVRHDGRDYVIDWSGRQLPPIYAPGGSTLRFIYEPVMPPPVHADGSRDFLTAWPGEDIVASLELISVALGRKWANQVAGVDASGYSSRATLELVTDRDTRVLWGGRPSKPLVGEVSTPQKLANIEALFRSKDRIDGAHARARINLAHIISDNSASAAAATAQRP